MFHLVDKEGYAVSRVEDLRSHYLLKQRTMEYSFEEFSKVFGGGALNSSATVNVAEAAHDRQHVGDARPVWEETIPGLGKNLAFSQNLKGGLLELLQ